jgi:hypothetical protein
MSDNREEIMSALRAGESRFTPEQAEIARCFRSVGAYIVATPLRVEGRLETWVNIGIPPHIAKNLVEILGSCFEQEKAQ